MSWTAKLSRALFAAVVCAMVFLRGALLTPTQPHALLRKPVVLSVPNSAGSTEANSADIDFSSAVQGDAAPDNNSVDPYAAAQLSDKTPQERELEFQGYAAVTTQAGPAWNVLAARTNPASLDDPYFSTFSILGESDGNDSVQTPSPYLSQITPLTEK